MYNTSWNDFIGKNSNNLTGAFEDLARYLFRKKYDVSYALPYFKCIIKRPVSPSKERSDKVPTDSSMTVGIPLEKITFLKNIPVV